MQNDWHSLWVLIEVKNKKTKTKTPRQTTTKKTTNKKNTAASVAIKDTDVGLFLFFCFLKNLTRLIILLVLYQRHCQRVHFYAVILHLLNLNFRRK